jgi:superfamily II DNA or RNA helicase
MYEGASSRTGNWLFENDLVIARLDKLARDEYLKAKLETTDWDLIICDEAHKMSASFFGNEVKYTKRYKLGQLLSKITRHFLLLTATPHNGKEEDFHLFMAFLDGDRFEDKFRDGVHKVDVSDIMRRLVEDEDREDLVVDTATAAQTIAQHKTEILQLKHLEQLAQTILRSGHDRKWDEVSKLIQKKRSKFDTDDNPRKLVIYTEHRDTLEYLKRTIQMLAGERDIVAVIYGGMTREERRKSEKLFKNHKSKEILIATDAAGEGINLQRAHLMINYDLPWNPNRLEQRFGRIHRIG